MSPKVGVAPLRREQIVRATIRCLVRDGYARLTMKQVAREARVSQGILHYYFADKRAILVAALETAVADLDRRVGAAQARSGRDPRARLRALIRAALASSREDRAAWIVFVEFWGAMLHDPKLRTINAEQYGRMRRLIGSLVAQGVKTRRFRRLAPARAAAVILGLLDGVSLQLAFDDRVFTLAAAAEFCEEALTRYLTR